MINKDIRPISEDTYFNKLGRIVDAILEKSGKDTDYKNIAETYTEELIEIKDAILGRPGRTLTSIRENNGNVPENMIPKTYEDCLEAIRCAILDKEWNSNKYLIDCLTAVEPSKDLLGKKANQLATNIKFNKDTKEVYGHLLYVKDYTGFNSDKEEQNGYFFPFAFKADDKVTEAYFKVLHGDRDISHLKGKEVKCDAENICFLGKTKAEAITKEIVITAVRADGVEEKIYLDMNGLTYEAVSTVTTKNTKAIVSSTEALVKAMSNPEVKNIKLASDIVVEHGNITFEREMTFDGNGKKITFNESGKNLVFTKDSKIKNVVIENTADNTEWNSNYGIQVYNGKYTVENLKVSGCNAGLLVNGSECILSGAVDVSGNTFGGIEVSNGEHPAMDAKLVIKNRIKNNSESYKRPTVWIDSENATVKDETKLLKEVNIESQKQFYYDETYTTGEKVKVLNKEEFLKAIGGESTAKVVELYKDTVIDTATNLNKEGLKIVGNGKAFLSELYTFKVDKDVELNGVVVKNSVKDDSPNFRGNYGVKVHTGCTVTCNNFRVEDKDALACVKNGKLILNGVIDCTTCKSYGVEMSPSSNEHRACVEVNTRINVRKGLPAISIFKDYIDKCTVIDNTGLLVEKIDGKGNKKYFYED